MAGNNFTYQLVSGGTGGSLGVDQGSDAADPGEDESEGSGGGGGGGSNDHRSKYCELIGFADGRPVYRRVGPAALDWNYATRDRWNPELATDIDRTIADTSKPTQDATRVYRRHRPADRDNWHAGSLNDIFLIPCEIHRGDKDADGNAMRRLVVGIDKADFYHTDEAHGVMHHMGVSDIPPRGIFEHEVIPYFHPKSHTLRFKTWTSGGGWSPG